MTLYECLQEIRKVTGWSQERISTETGLALSTISRILRVPGYEPSEVSESLILQLYEELVRQPFPNYLQKLFRLYDRMQGQSSQKDFGEFLSILEPLLHQHKSLDNGDLAACRIFWLLGHIYYDRAFYLKSDSRAMDQAVEYYHKALSILEEVGDNGLLAQKYKLQQCLVAIKFNAIPAEERAHSKELRDWLKGLGYLELAAAVIQEDSWNWMVARNGLIAASISQNWSQCDFFWRALREANKHFSSIDFKPANELPAVSQDPDLRWFVSQLREREERRRNATQDVLVNEAN